MGIFGASKPAMPVSAEPDPLDGASLLYLTVGVLSLALLLRAMPKGAPDSLALLLFFAFWYVGNAFYNQYNTMALEGECAQTQDLVGLGLGAVPCDLQAPAASTAV